MTGRKRTKYQGVFQRELKNKHMGKPDICYEIKYQVDGKQYWEVVGNRSEGYDAGGAAHVRSDRIRTAKRGDNPRTHIKSPTFEHVWSMYQQNLSAKGGVNDGVRYNKHIRSCIGQRRLSAITPLDIERVKANAESKGLSPQTVHHILALIRRIFRKAIAWGLYNGKVPTNGVKWPTVDNARDRWLDESEAKPLLDEIRRRSPLWHDISYISLYTGMRFGEIAALRGQDLDMKEGIILVRDAKAGSRKAFMTDRVRAILSHHMPHDPSALVFVNRSGERIKEVSKTFERAVDAVGLNDNVSDPRARVVFHTLRHSFASRLATLGTPMLVISELLGHSDYTTTRRYAHLSPDNKREAVSALAAAFNEHDE